MIALFMLFLVGLVQPVRHPVPLPNRHPRIAHFLPYIFGDSLRALKRAKRLGFKYIDLNLNLTKDLFPVVGHWARFWFDGYRYVMVKRGGSKPKAHPKARWVNGEWIVKSPYKKSMSLHSLTWKQVQLLRTRKGRKYYLARVYMIHAHALGITCCFELKGTWGWGSPVFQMMASWAIDADASVVLMMLQSMGTNAKVFEILNGARTAGFAAALLPRRKKPHDWESKWVPAGIKQWGRWR